MRRPEPTAIPGRGVYATTTAVPSRSQLGRLTAPDGFWWATGIEDTFVTAPWPATGRTLDEYELTGHYERWEEDLGLVAELGVKTARYGVPWHRIQPSPDRWDWSFADKALGRLLELGVDPIVDLVHYGLPSWIDGAYLNPRYPEHVAEYARRLAERFRGRLLWYTPLNEPRITAWYCGRLGWWPPFLRGWRGFVTVMLAVCRGIVRTIEALYEVDPEIVPVHVDATDLFETKDPSLEEEARRRQEIVFLALDLVSGRVTKAHELWGWLLEHGASAADLAWFEERAVDLPVIGMNMYPMFTQKRLLRDAGGRLRIKLPYASGDLVDHLGRLYYKRYRAPLMISETASVGSLRRRRAWLDASVAAVRELRQDGVPLVGYTWWPMFALVTWAYRQGRRPASAYLAQMGLWDIDPEPSAGMRRVRTSLVDSYLRLVAGEVASVGLLSQSEQVPAASA
jgi:beta-glucosidase/6-phospho-beta-glucosidase/beta-galactosidase